jgi:hypothetical protein
MVAAPVGQVLGLSRPEHIDHLLDVCKFDDVGGQLGRGKSVVVDRGHLIEYRTQLAQSNPLIYRTYVRPTTDSRGSSGRFGDFSRAGWSAIGRAEWARSRSRETAIFLWSDWTDRNIDRIGAVCHEGRNRSREEVKREMMAMTERQTLAPPGSLRRRARNLTITAIVLAGALIGLTAWLVYDLSAESETAVTSEVQTLVDDYLGAWNEYDGDAFMELITGDYSFAGMGVSHFG